MKHSLYIAIVLLLSVGYLQAADVPVIEKPGERQWHNRRTMSIAFLPDGKRFITASRDNTARIWDATSGEELHVIREHADAVNSVSFSPDGKRFVGAMRDGTALIVDIDSGEVLHILRGDGVTSVFFFPDGKKVATADTGDGSIRIWDVESGNVVQTLKGHARGPESNPFNTGEVRIVFFFPDGKRIVTSGDEDTKIWDVDSGKALQTLKFPSSAGALSPNGNELLLGGTLGKVQIWDMDLEKMMKGFGDIDEDLSWTGHSGYIAFVSFFPDGKRIVTISSSEMDGNTTRIWDIESGRQLQKLWGFRYSTSSIAFLPGGNRIITSNDDGDGDTARIWDADSGVRLQVLPHSFQRHGVLGMQRDGPSSFAFSPDGKKVVTGSFYGSVRVWTLEQ